MHKGTEKVRLHTLSINLSYVLNIVFLSLKHIIYHMTFYREG